MSLFGGIPAYLRKLKTMSSTAAQIDGQKNINYNSIVLDGDSITNQNGYAPNSNNTSATGWFVQGNLLLMNRFSVLANNAIARERTDQLLARLQNSINLKPKYLAILIGTNDLGQSIPVDTIKSNLLEIYNRINNAGIVSIFLTVPPRSTSVGSIVANTFEVNNYLKYLNQTKPNFILVDTFSSISDGTTCLAKANTTVDGIHPSAQGAYLMGLEFYKVMDKYLKEVNMFTESLDTVGSKLLNPNMIGGATVATSWVKNGTAVASKVARTKFGEWQQLYLDGTESYIYAPMQNLVIGEKVKAIAEIDYDASFQADSYSVSIRAKNSSNADLATTTSTTLFSNQPIRLMQNVMLNGCLETGEITIPLGTTNVYIFITAKGTGNIRIGRCRFIKVS